MILDQFGFPVTAKKPASSKWRSWARVIATAVIVMLCNAAYRDFSHKNKPYKFTMLPSPAGLVAPPLTQLSAPLYSTPERMHAVINDPPLTASLRAAVVKWRVAMGRNTPYPALVEAHGFCADREATACAVAADWTIYWEGYPNGRPDNLNLTNIFMHEYGHLLGVPHISGDPLMNWSYSGESTRFPSAAAVAIALLYSDRYPKLKGSL